jgi:hypothetical protein
MACFSPASIDAFVQDECHGMSDRPLNSRSHSNVILLHHICMSMCMSIEQFVCWQVATLASCLEPACSIIGQITRYTQNITTVSVYTMQEH